MLLEKFPYIGKFKKNAFGEAIGIIVWKTWYPALIFGNHQYVATYNFPVRVKFIDKWRASEEKKEEWGGWNLPEFIKCAKELESEGVAAITTNCGMLGSIQVELAEAVNIPVFTSSLLQVPLVAKMIKKEQIVGILIVSAEVARAQNYRVLRSCGIDESISYVMRGMDESENADIWMKQFKEDSCYDPKQVENVIVLEAQKLICENPNVGAIVLECTEMPLYAAAIQEATGLPVFDITTLTEYVYNAIVKKHYF